DACTRARHLSASARPAADSLRIPRRQSPPSLGLAMKLREANVLLAPFLEHARHAPQDVAVRTRDTQLSYAELANEVLRLAAALDDLAIGPDDIVALGTERTPNTIALILAIT